MRTADTTSAHRTPSVARTPAIELAGVSKTFNARSGNPVCALKDVSLTVQPGEIIALLGTNGAGKTTLVDIILGLTTPSAGTVSVMGQTPKQAVYNQNIGALMQTGGLLNDLTVKDTLKMIAATFPQHLPLDEVVAQANLEPIYKRRVGKCSGGEQQRIRFALAILGDPDILILDEPTAGMDVSARIAFWETMRTQTRRGRTVLFATHYLEEAASFADRIVIIAHGRLVADGNVDEIRALGDGALVTATWPGLSEESLGQHLADCPAAGSIKHAVIHGEHVELRTTDSDAVARWLLSTTPAEHLGIGAASLNEVFTALTSDGSDEAAL